jgi:hypothetical protein
MATWDNADFDREATAIARAFWAGRDQNGASLNELATKVARDNGLNPEQIRRLCRNTNTKAFEQKYAALKGQADRSPYFELADPEAVIENLRQTVAVAHTKQAEAEYPDLPDEYAPPPPNPKLFAREKIAALTHEIDNFLPSYRSPFVELRRAEKQAADLAIERHQLNFAWDDAINAIVEHTRYQNWNHDDFEKNAVALFGADVLPELNAIRYRCGRSELGEGAAENEVKMKLAELQQKWVGIPDELTNRLKVAMEIRAKFETLIERQNKIATKIANLKKVTRHG